MQRVLITPDGHKRLAEELRNAKEVQRPKVVKDIEEARAHGDISENSEYEDAKERQALIEGRIRMLEAQLAVAEIIDPARQPPSDRVVFGCTVRMVDLATDAEVLYQVVGDLESDVRQGRISYTSPLGKALIGKSEGDEVVFDAPNGRRTFEILGIEQR